MGLSPYEKHVRPLTARKSIDGFLPFPDERRPVATQLCHISFGPIDVLPGHPSDLSVLRIVGDESVASCIIIDVAQDTNLSFAECNLFIESRNLRVHRMDGLKFAARHMCIQIQDSRSKIRTGRGT